MGGRSKSSSSSWRSWNVERADEEEEDDVGGCGAGLDKQWFPITVGWGSQSSSKSSPSEKDGGSKSTIFLSSLSFLEFFGGMEKDHFFY